jgi:HD-GYP domain-containing protein (c-di-GMP phosphodiesterase class II)
MCISARAHRSPGEGPTISVMLLAERLVGEARRRRSRGMVPREKRVLGASAGLFVIAAAAIAVYVPNERDVDVLVVLGLIAGYALIERVRFEFGGYYGTAEQLVLVPIVLLAPLPAVPAIIGATNLLAMLPDILEGRWHRERLTGKLADCWYCVPPVLVLAALAPGEPSFAESWAYLAAFAAQLVGDIGWSLVRAYLLDEMPLRELAASWLGSARVDATFAPIGLIISVPAVDYPLVLLVIAPLIWLLRTFSKDREERYAKTLELHRAYRGTVMLLSDVVEFDDNYTAQHSRLVVELVNAVADELRIDLGSRQELEFAAMLHDVGKITIPKEILNKPTALTASEFEVMKTHTIEGQFMLDRVGGLLGRVGEIVRSCHERWDGTGYPDGLAGEDIPLAARIVFACDAYQAMTSDRAYRPALSKAEALEELTANSGSQFDPGVVAALTKVVQERELASPAVDEVRALLAGQPTRPDVAARPSS